jgi:hypothetical protein
MSTAVDDHLMYLIAHDRLEQVYAEADQRRLLKEPRRARRASERNKSEIRTFPADCRRQRSAE